MKDLEYYKIERAQQWREELRKNLKAKDRTSLDRCQMVEQDPMQRNTNFSEVNLGISEEIAYIESRRCLDCADPTCIDGCPVNINIPKFIKKIELKDFLGAAAILKETNTLPAVCGRVCPQEKQCENSCFYTVKRNLRNRPLQLAFSKDLLRIMNETAGKFLSPKSQKVTD